MTEIDTVIHALDTITITILVGCLCFVMGGMGANRKWKALVDERDKQWLREIARRLVRDADDDCHRDKLQTIPDMPRRTIDRALLVWWWWAIAKEPSPVKRCTRLW